MSTNATPTGYYFIGDNVAFAHHGPRPNWFHLTMMRVVLGMKWRDA